MPKWEEEDGLSVEEEKEKEGEGYHTFTKIEFILDKNLQSGKGVVSKILANLLKNAGDITGI